MSIARITVTPNYKPDPLDPNKDLRDAIAAWRNRRAGSGSLERILQAAEKDLPPAPTTTARQSATPDQRKHAKAAADGVMSMCGWFRTAEGGEFWNAVHARITQIAKDGILA